MRVPGSSIAPSESLAGGAYRVEWHAVSTLDGQPLEALYATALVLAALLLPVLTLRPGCLAPDGLSGAGGGAGARATSADDGIGRLAGGAWGGERAAWAEAATAASLLPAASSDVLLASQAAQLSRRLRSSLLSS